MIDYLVNNENKKASTDCESVKANNKNKKSNNIVVTFKDINEKVKVKIIYLKNEKLMIRTLSYDEDTVTVGDNAILDKVKSFQVKRKKNLVYYYIENKESKVRGRCI